MLVHVGNPANQSAKKAHRLNFARSVRLGQDGLRRKYIAKIALNEGNGFGWRSRMSNTHHHISRGQFNRRWDSLKAMFHNTFSNEPKEWRKIYKHAKRRAEWKQRYQEIMQGRDVENMAFPLDKRPWIYYW
jgi:hypothetical protein